MMKIQIQSTNLKRMPKHEIPILRSLGDILHFAFSSEYFPLTPALSLGERENRPPSFGKTRDAVCQASARKTSGHRWLFPLPEGEGQGEAKRRFQSQPVSPIQRTPQYVAFQRPGSMFQDSCSFVFTHRTNGKRALNSQLSTINPAS